MEWAWLAEAAKLLGVPGAMLLLALVAGARGWWVFGSAHREILGRADRERDKAERHADRLQERLDQALGLAATAACRLPPGRSERSEREMAS